MGSASMQEMNHTLSSDLYFICRCAETDPSMQSVCVLCSVFGLRDGQTNLRVTDWLPYQRFNVLLQQQHGRFGVEALHVAGVMLVEDSHGHPLQG